MSTASMPRAAERQRLTRLVHIAKRDLQMDNDTYRAALRTATATETSTGKDYCSAMSAAELQKALDHLKRCGFKVKGKVQPSRPANTPLAHKIRALWAELHQVGKVRDPSPAALDRWIKRETKIEALAWLDVVTAGRAVERLKKWLER